jgi:putative transposase
MARKPRIEFEGACYHVFNVGADAAGLFTTPDAAQAFTDLLLEAVVRMQWRLHAYCLTRDRYHLALETPQGNLTAGVHWLQSAYGNRFTRFHGARRRAFRSRFRAILVEPGAPWARLVDYIHLRPAETGLVPFARLGQFRWSSYRTFARGAAGRPPGLMCADWLSTEGMEDSPEGWRAYADRLAALSANEHRRAEAGFARMCRGWAHGSEAFCEERRRDVGRMAAAQDWGAPRLAELNRREWETRLAAGTRALGRELATAPTEPKSAPWKIALAAWLRRHTSATNPWLTAHLHMGPPDAVSRYVSEVRLGKRPLAAAPLALLSAVS